jgi:peptidoglycan lytic transglycosylase G
MRRLRLFLALATVLVAGAYLGWVYTRTVTLPAPVVVVIEHGASSARIAAQLKQAGVIDDAWAFKVLVRLTGEGESLRSGYYRFEGSSSILHVLERMLRGDVMRFSVTIPEGLRTDEVLALLAAQTGVPLATWQQALTDLLPKDQQEGRLLPETYDYEKPVVPKAMLERMIQAQHKVLAAAVASEPGTDTAKQIRIIASIIEKETHLDKERPLIAAVIYNRLQKHMPLQMDPTVIYGIWATQGSFSGNLHKEDMERDTPWNTYTNRGLPPTPICNPSKASIEAAANPAEVDYLYFVANGTGGHAFASTMAEHEANVLRWIHIYHEQEQAREHKDAKGE